MGIGGSKKEPEKPPVTAESLKTILIVCQNKCSLNRNKRINTIKKKKDEIIHCLKQNNMDLAMAKMDNLLKDEDYITACDILNPILEILKERYNYITSNKECPADLRAPLDTVIYSATRMEIEELIQFKEKITQHYGTAYVTKAENNVDKLVNKDLVEKLQATCFSQQLIKIKMQQLCKEKKIQFKGNEVVPGGDWEVPVNIEKNPYESMRPNFPTQNQYQNNQANNPYPNFNGQQNPQPPNQGGFNDGFPRQPPNQGGFNNNFARQPPQQSGFPGQNQYQGGFPGPNQFQGGFPSQSQISKNFPTQSQIQKNLPTQSQVQKGFPGMENQGNNQDGFPGINNQGSNDFQPYNPYADNNNNQQNSGSNNSNQQTSESNIFGNTITGTAPILETSEHLEESHSTNNNNSQVKSSQKNINGSENNIAQTMSPSVANPDNKENPYEGKSSVFGPTIPIEELPNDKKGSVNPYIQGSKLSDPLNVPTVVEESPSDNKEGVNPYIQGSKLSDPMNVPTIPLDEETKKSIQGTNNLAPSTKKEEPKVSSSLAEEEIKKNKSTNPFDTKMDNPLGGPTLPEEEIKQYKSVNPFEAKMDDPLGGPTLPEHGSLKPGEGAN